MKKQILLFIFICISIACNQTREEKILGRLNAELFQRGIEIDSFYGSTITISPILDKTESLTLAIDELFAQKNEDSLKAIIEEKANYLKQWFTLPKWNHPNSFIEPHVHRLSQLEESNIVVPKTDTYAIGFTHINTAVHKPTIIQRDELDKWKLTDAEFRDWSLEYLNKIYLEDSELVKTKFQDWEVYQIESNFGKSANTLLFSTSFEMNASEELQYPFYAILGEGLPAYVFKRIEFGNFYKEWIFANGKQYPFPIEILKYTSEGISIVSLKE